ncbi:unnamed protein product [Arctogadus glacialis]
MATPPLATVMRRGLSDSRGHSEVRSLSEEEETQTVTNPSPAEGSRGPESCPLPSTSESTKEEWSSDTEPSQKQKTAHRKQKSSARCDAVPTLYLIEPHRGLLPAPPGQDGSVRASKVVPQRHTAEEEPRAQCAPPSPVHLALRQAVSEVLFSTWRASSSVPPRCAPPAPPQPQGPDGSGQPPKEVLSQLLRDAEDSDGEENGNDSLPQVLCKQRTRVKDQISQVDSLMEEFRPDGEEA